MRGIELLIDAGIQTTISCPVMRTNYHSYSDVLKWAGEMGMKCSTDFIMMARSDFTTENLSERLSMVEMESLLRDIVSTDTEYRDRLDASAEAIEQQMPSLRQSEKQVCGVGISSLCISADGTYYPCSGWQGFKVGNARTQELKDVWENSPQLEKLRAISWDSFPECLECADYDFCAMCMVRNFNESGGDMLKINRHFCDAAKLNKRVANEYIEGKGICRGIS